MEVPLKGFGCATSNFLIKKACSGSFLVDFKGRRGGGLTKKIEFLCFHICLSPGYRGSEAFYRIEKSFFVLE